MTCSEESASQFAASNFLPFSLISSALTLITLIFCVVTATETSAEEFLKVLNALHTECPTYTSLQGNVKRYRHVIKSHHWMFHSLVL